MAKDWSSKSYFNRKSTQQFIDTYKEKYDLLKVDGILSVRSSSNGRLLNNKERYYT
ncbi:hypothetical protein GAG94_03170 [Lysinibacillus sphaericus]|nr:hypothetical protein GAG94_03170 [Lysinibacillus sphaericus]